MAHTAADILIESLQDWGVIVIKNNTLGQIKWEQMVFLGNRTMAAIYIRSIFAQFARACGGTGLRVEDPVQCGAVLDQALATARPVVVEAVVDPFMPPFPAKITLDQAEKIRGVTCPWRAEPFENRLDSALRKNP